MKNDKFFNFYYLSDLFSAANFSKLFAELEESQATITKSVSGNKELLQNVQKAFADNHENVSQEVTKLEQRMSQLTKKWMERINKILEKFEIILSIEIFLNCGCIK